MRLTPADMAEDLRKRRAVSVGLRRTVMIGDDPKKALATAAWFRADELAAGVGRLASARPPCAEAIGVLGRSLWEGAVRIQYVAADPNARLLQMRNHALREEAKILNGEWAKGAKSQIDPRYWEFQNEAKAEPDKDRLPPLVNMARSLGVEGQYDMIYRLESSGAHWGLTAVGEHAKFHRSGQFVVSARGQHRLPQVMALAASTYAVIVAHCAELAGLSPLRLERLRTKLSAAMGRLRKT